MIATAVAAKISSEAQTHKPHWTMEASISMFIIFHQFAWCSFSRCESFRFHTIHACWLYIWKWQLKIGFVCCDGINFKLIKSHAFAFNSLYLCEMWKFSKSKCVSHSTLCVPCGLFLLISLPFACYVCWFHCLVSLDLSFFFSLW